VGGGFDVVGASWDEDRRGNYVDNSHHETRAPGTHRNDQDMGYD